MMNQITKQCISEAIKSDKAQARAHKSGFKMEVEGCWYHALLLEFGIRYKQRFLDLLRGFHPELFEGEFLRDYIGEIYDLDVIISHRVLRMMERRVKQYPAWQLEMEQDDFWPYVDLCLARAEQAEQRLAQAHQLAKAWAKEQKRQNDKFWKTRATGQLFLW